MNLRAYLILSVAAFLLFIAGCQQNPTEPTATKASSISGLVFDAENKPLALARVIDIGSLAPVDTSKSDGSYKLKLELTDNYTTSLYAILTGYTSDTQKVTLKPGDNITQINFHMKVQDSSKIVISSSGRPASIVLLTQSVATIALKGTGKNESCILTFVVKDSSGTPVVGSSQCVVKFVLSGGPGGGEYLLPTSAQTNPLTGQVSTTISSGSLPGVLQVIASTRGDSVKASPVFLAAGGGLADSAGVSIGATNYNIAGRKFGNLRTTIVLSVGDRFGNPVAAGTMVSFQTDPVARLSAFSASTDKDGNASVDLMSTMNRPPTGFVTVIATTSGDKSYRASDSIIVRAIQILFSGTTQPPTLGANAAGFTVPDGGISYFDFTVADELGNPLVAQSQVTVSITGPDSLAKDLELLNPVNVFKGTKLKSETNFSIGVRDKGTSKASGAVTFGIKVTSVNGDYENQNWCTGYVSGSVGASLNVPASIVCTDTVQTILYLKEAGTNNQKRVTFAVKDFNGNPVSKAAVNFTLSESPIGTTLSKVKDSTNVSGEVSVDVLSGYMQGEAKVLATTGSLFGYSLPIQISRGLPDSNAIFLVLNKKNMFNKSDVVGKVSVTLMDRFGYPAVPQIIRGTTSGGWVGLIPATIDGKTSFDLNGGSFPNDPVRGPGYGYVSVIVPAYYADVVGSRPVTKSIPFLFSGAPATITFDPAKVTGSTLIAPLVQNGSVTITYKFADANNRPLSSGNKFTVSASGAASSELQLSGDINVVLADDTTLTTYSVTVTDKGGSGGPFTLTFTTTGESGTLAKSITGTVSGSTSGYASSIQMLTAIPATISVKATGETETSIITFQVKDSLGNPITAMRSDSIHFSFAGGGIGGGEFLIPTAVLTDANGKATTTVNAGTVSGVLQLIASMGAIKSAPVQLVIQSGLADAEHVTAGFLPAYVTSATYDTTLFAMGSPIASIGVILGDKYSNPARSSAVYFTSNGNLINPSAVSVSGVTPPVSIIRAYPNPPGGKDTITVTTKGQGGQDITRKIFLTAVGSQTSAVTPPTQIVLSTLSSSIIAASGTGGLNTSDLTFQALDAGGRAIGTAQSDTMFFSLSDTVGGAHLIPTWAMTDASGIASTKLYGGIKYGSPTITARMKAVLSQPVPVRISGPSWTNFNVTISSNNLPGLSQIGTKVGFLNAQIGDTLGNPVLAGTIIKFITSGGMVDASAVTDVSGSASANLSGGATPNEPSLGGIGWGYVSAQTQGDNGTTLQKNIPFLFSGAPIIRTVNVPSNDTIILLDGGYLDVDYKIADGYGNPLAAGNQVQVTVTGAAASEISLSNYVNFLTNGTTDINQTTFRVRIADRLPSSGTGGYFDITITVGGPNGNRIKQFHGYLRAPGAITPPSPSAKYPAQIAFVSVSATDIYVSGTGSTETSVITYEVRDSLGTLIESNPRAFAQFTLQFFPNTFTNTGTLPRLIPNSDSTDDNARLHVSIASGTQAGVVQVYSQIDLGGGRFVKSQPVKISVHAGFADQRHFTIAPDAFNFPGLERAFLKSSITVQVVDQYSNPVLLGTSVYFNTMHGSIGTGKSGTSVGITDVDGFVSQYLWSSNPYPEFADALNIGPGLSWIYSRTLGESAAWVVDSALIVWTGQPIISDVAGPGTFAIPNGGSAGPWTFTVADRYGHPMSQGTKITVAGPGLVVDGDGASLTYPDIGPDQRTFIVPAGPGITTFTVLASDADPTTFSVPPTKSILTITVSHPVYGVYTRIIATGTVQ